MEQLKRLFNDQGFFPRESHQTRFHSLLPDPDLEENDGVYSRYLTDFPGGVGRYSVELEVDDNGEKAFSYQRVVDGEFPTYVVFEQMSWLEKNISL